MIVWNPKKTEERAETPAMKAEVDEDDGSFTNVSLADDPGTVGLTRWELVVQTSGSQLNQCCDGVKGTQVEVERVEVWLQTKLLPRSGQSKA